MDSAYTGSGNGSFLQLPLLDNSEHSWLLGNAAALNSAEQYFFRVSIEMNRLRSGVATFGSKHITQREMHMMIGFSEHGLLMLCQQKCLLNSVAENLTTRHNLLSNFSSTAEILPTRQSILTNRLSDFELQLKSLLEIFSQVLLLMKKSLLLVDDNAKKANIRDLIVFVDSSLLRLNSSHNKSDARFGEIQNLQFISSEKVCTVTNTLNTLNDMEQELQVYHNNLNGCLPKEIFTSCLRAFQLTRQSAQSFVESSAMDKNNNDSVDLSHIKKNFLLISSTVQKSLIAIQGLCRKDAATSENSKMEGVDNDDNSFSSTSLKECHSQNVKEWLSLDINKVNYDLKLLSTNIIQMFDWTSDVTEEMKICFLANQSACKLPNNMLFVSRSRNLDFIHFYRNSAKLIYLLLRVFRALVAKGFCADNMEDEDEGNDGKATNFEDDVEGK